MHRLMAKIRVIYLSTADCRLKQTERTSGDHLVLMGMPARLTTAEEPLTHASQSPCSAIVSPGYVEAACDGSGHMPMHGSKFWFQQREK